MNIYTPLHAAAALCLCSAATKPVDVMQVCLPMFGAARPTGLVAIYEDTRRERRSVSLIWQLVKGS